MRCLLRLPYLEDRLYQASICIGRDVAPPDRFLVQGMKMIPSLKQRLR